MRLAPDSRLHSLEEATNMLDRPEILVGDHVGVVAGRVIRPFQWALPDSNR
jgi:hypothetical protein